MLIVSYNHAVWYGPNLSFVSVFNGLRNDHLTDIATMSDRPFNNSVWMVPGTFNPDDED